MERGAGEVGSGLLQLGRCEAGVSLGLRQGASQTPDLRPVDAADTRKAPDRSALAPTGHRLDPLGRPAVIGQVLVHADRVAVDRGRRQRPQRSAHGGGAGLVHEPETRRGVALGEQERAFLVHREHSELPIVEALRDRPGLPRLLDCLVKLALAPRGDGVREREVAVLGRLGLGGEEAHGAVLPA